MKVPTRWGLLLAAYGLTGVLAACGASPVMPVPTPVLSGAGLPTPSPKPSPSPSASAKTTKKPTKATPSVKPSPGATAKPSPVATPVAQPLYQRALAQYRALQTYTADVQSYGKAQGKDIGAKAKLTWKRPSRLRVEILDTNIANGDRTVIVDNGTGGVRAKAPGWWPFPVNVERTDPKLQLPGGPRYDEATIGGVLGYFESAGAQVTLQGEIEFMGRQVAEYHVRNALLTSRGLSHARIGLDTQTLLPVFCEQVNDEGIATQLVFSNVATDVPQADSLFSL
jgi:outer membrane lipoprotein-sorting protein